jgi:hypothetical protein
MISQSEEHSRKQKLSRTSTVAGREIDSNDEQSENANSPNRASFDPDSMTIFESEEQRMKQKLSTTVTVAGREIDCNDEQFAN